MNKVIIKNVEIRPRSSEINVVGLDIVGYEQFQLSMDIGNISLQ